MAKRGFQGAVLRGFGARDHQATVVSTRVLSPNFLRIELTSPTLFEDAVVSPTAWVRFWFPDPDGRDVEHQRAYTLSEADPESGAFSIDVVLHEPSGAASTWAATAQPGATISLTSLGSSKFELPEELPAGYLLIGDSASIPAITGILQTIPAEVPIELYLEEHEATDRLIPLPGHPRLRTHWVPRRGAESLAAAIEARDWSDWYAWAATEAASLKLLRSRLRDDFGVPKSEVYQLAYWVHGRSMGTLRSGPDQRAGAPAAEPEPSPADVPATEQPVAAQAPATAQTAPRAAAPGVWRAQAAGRLVASRLAAVEEATLLALVHDMGQAVAQRDGAGRRDGLGSPAPARDGR